jgi:hypothetical protein
MLRGPIRTCRVVLCARDYPHQSSFSSVRFAPGTLPRISRRQAQVASYSTASSRGWRPRSAQVSRCRHTGDRPGWPRADRALSLWRLEVQFAAPELMMSKPGASSCEGSRVRPVPHQPRSRGLRIGPSGLSSARSRPPAPGFN